MIDLDAIAAGILDGSINEKNLSDKLHGDEGFRLAVLAYLLDLTDAALSGSGGGAVRQVVIVPPMTGAATGTNAAPTWAVVYSGSITTTQADSHVIALCVSNFGGAANFATFARMERGGVALVQGDAAGARTRTFIGPLMPSNSGVYPGTVVGHDTPGAVGTYQYDLSLATENAGFWFVNRSFNDNDLVERPRTATAMYLFEVAP